jgi:hypothetical protein
MANKDRSIDHLRQEGERLQAALRVEQASALVASQGLPPSFVGVLAATPPEEQEQKAAQIAAEIAQRTGVPAGPANPRDQEGGDPAGAVGGDALEGTEDQVDPVRERPELAAVTKSGPEGANPPNAGPLNPGDARSQAIRSSSNWDELEQALRSRKG